MDLQLPPRPGLWLPKKPALILPHRHIKTPVEARGLKLAMLPGFMGLPGLMSPDAAPAGVTVTFVQQYQFSTASTSYTQLAVPIGAASANRIVLVWRGGRSAGSTGNGSGTTFGGVSGTLVTPGGTINGSGFSKSQFYYRNVPTGTTTDIVTTFGSTQQTCILGVWVIEGAASTTPFDTAGSDGTVSTPISLDIPAGGVGFFATQSGGANIPFPTMFATEDWNNVFDSYGSKGQHEIFASATTENASGIGTAPSGYNCAVSFG